MKSSTTKILLAVICGLGAGVAVTIAVSRAYRATSQSSSCMSCHYHSAADDAWKQSVHCLNESGVTTGCAECHLPPEGTWRHFAMKTRMGIKDIWTYITKNKEDLEWEYRKDLEYASGIVPNESCVACHSNIFPQGLSDDGITAHLYYDENAAKLDLQCISCHMDAGHFNPNYKHSKMTGIPGEIAASAVRYDAPAEVTAFENYTETIPGTAASINMIAVKGGTFTIGSPESEPFHKKDEGPQKSITVSDFFMAETEITWDQYWAFYAETMSEGRLDPEIIYEHNSRTDIDAVSGPTPPFGAPDQGWGQGSRPAITMTHYAAQTFCQWLSMKTGRTYRLPTEAEWEYAARGGTSTPYFFDADPRKLSAEGRMKHLFKPDTTGINGFAVYALNSRGRTAEPSRVKANPFGLKNMYGNAMEYCSDWYAPNAYSFLENGETDPQGPEEGTEHVVRGGAYNCDASQLRSASRSHTEHDRWLKTDPQMPKSIWWYSDIKSIGFRVVCEVPGEITE